MISQWQYPAASSEALDLLHSAMCAASHQHIVMAIEVASKRRSIVVIINFCCA
jgi:hypothetical protein